jgi:hypothetical protein
MFMFVCSLVAFGARCMGKARHGEAKSAHAEFSRGNVIECV